MIPSPTPGEREFTRKLLRNDQSHVGRSLTGSRILLEAEGEVRGVHAQVVPGKRPLVERERW